MMHKIVLLLNTTYSLISGFGKLWFAEKYLKYFFFFLYL